MAYVLHTIQWKHWHTAVVLLSFLNIAFTLLKTVKEYAERKVDVRIYLVHAGCNVAKINK